MLLTTNHQPSTVNRDRRAIIIWLALCALLVAAMVCIGGYTRLSGSGLSITSWKPIHGIVPPLDDAQWNEEFSAYQQSPQYQKVNAGMTLSEFKEIFWPEFIHRLLGRVIGAVFFIPLLVFAIRRSFAASFGWRLTVIFALGGLQGLIGWLMVKSGLIDDPHVSYIRLALHLSVAFAILGALLWSLLDVINFSPPLEGGVRGGVSFSMSLAQVTPHPNPPPQGGRELYIWFAILCLQIIVGAFMAGLHAGLIYNTWPTMNGQWLPDGMGSDNLTLVQFIHRTLAVLVAVGFLLWWYWQRGYVKNNNLGKVCTAVAVILAVQFILGVLTLVNAAPLPLALIHQMTALLLFAVSVTLLHMNMN